MQTTKEARRVLKKLNKSGVDYALIRNFNRLIANKPFQEKDIDILISNKNKKEMNKIMQKLRFKKLLICSSAGHQGFAKLIQGKFLSFHFHIGGIAGSHIRYLDAKILLKNKQQKNQLNIVSDNDYFLGILLHSILDGTRINRKYRKEIKKYSKQKLDWPYVREMLNSNVHPAITKKILKYLKQNQYKKLENALPKIQNNFKYGCYSRLLRFIQSKTKKFLWALWRASIKAPLISFIGMDGAGKSTMTSILKSRLDKSLITSVSIYTGRGRYNILPISFFGTKYKKIENKIDNRHHNLKKQKEETSIKRKIIYTLAAPIFALDLFLRYWLVIWPKRKTKQIVITDRYSTDMLLMANVPMLFKKTLYFFLPKPTVTIYLYNNPSVLYKRKKDHPLGDLKRQQRIFKCINKRIKPISIKSQGIKETFDKIVNHVWINI